MAEKRSGPPPKGGPLTGSDELQWWLDTLLPGKPPEETGTHVPYNPEAHDQLHDPSVPVEEPVLGALLDPAHIRPFDESGADLGDKIEQLYGENGRGIANYTLPPALLGRPKGGQINTPLPQGLIDALVAHYTPQLKQTLGSPRPSLPGGPLINVPLGGAFPRGPLINVPRTGVPTGGILITTPGPRFGGSTITTPLPRSLAGLRANFGANLAQVAKAAALKA